MFAGRRRGLVEWVLVEDVELVDFGDYRIRQFPSLLHHRRVIWGVAHVVVVFAAEADHRCRIASRNLGDHAIVQSKRLSSSAA